MPVFFALVDAMPGREADVETALGDRKDLRGYETVREGAHDFIVAFEQPSFDTVDDFLQTHIRAIQGVLGVEVIQDFDDYGREVSEAAQRLGA